MKFDVEFLMTNSHVEECIKMCEGAHLQQVCYSTYHKALTQICFGCRIIRTTVDEKEVKW